MSSISTSSGFVSGLNTLELIVNNNNNGINGQNLTQGPSSVFFSGTVTSGAVPEPATWAMMMIGLAALGTALRNRRRALNLAS